MYIIQLLKLISREKKMKLNCITITKQLIYYQKITAKLAIYSCFILLFSLISDMSVAAKGRVHMEYKQLTLRIKSYKDDYSINFGQLNKYALAEAGLFHSGFHEIVQCYYCGQKTEFTSEHSIDDLVTIKFHEKDCMYNGKTSLNTNNTEEAGYSNNPHLNDDKSHHEVSKEQKLTDSNKPVITFTNITNDEFDQNDFSTNDTSYNITCNLCSERSKVHQDIKLCDLANPLYIKHTKECDKSLLPFLSEKIKR